MRTDELHRYAQIPSAVSEAYICAAHRLRDEPAVKRRRKLSPALGIAISLTLVAVTALAVAHSLHIIDLFGVGRVDPEEAKTVIQTAVEQTGGETSLGTFKVSEAFYDGTFLRFIVESAFAEDTVLIDESFMQWKDDKSIAGLPGKRVGLRVSAACPDLMGQWRPIVYAKYGEGGRLLIGDAFIPEGVRAEALRLDVSIDLLDINDGSVIDGTVLTFTVRKTAEAATTEFAVDARTDFVAVDKVTIARTPLAVFASVEYRPLLRAFGSFTVVPDDGYIQRDGRAYYYGAYSDMPRFNDGKGVERYLLPVEYARGNTLTLWVTGTDEAFVIDLHTGEASVKKVVTHFEGKDKRIEIVED